MTGYTHEEFTELGVLGLHPAKDLPKVIEKFEAQARGEIALAAELPVQRKDGSVFFADINTALVELEGETYLMGAFRDVTERMKLHAGLAQSDRLASMGMLAAGVAHEINNPLAYVLYNLESLADDVPELFSAFEKCRSIARQRLGDELWAELFGPERELLGSSWFDDIRARLQDALKGVERIKGIVRGLGTFSRVDEERLEPVDLADVLEAATDMVFNEIKYRCRLVKEYGETATILANDGRLAQVFLNLLLNAAHAIGEGGIEDNEIRVKTWQQGDEVFAEVRDTGAGIPKNIFRRVFDPFFTTKGVGSGTGLGLSISRNIVETYGGRIEVTSEVGKGSRFVVRLPVHKPDATSEAAPEKNASQEAPRRGRVLVVDDELGIRSVVARVLQDHDVVQAGSGGEARELLETDQAFDAVLCDVMMPSMSGVDLHEWLSNAFPDLAKRMVFMTGGAFTSKARDYLNNVDNHRLDKPFDTAHLKKIIAELIEARRSGRL